MKLLLLVAAALVLSVPGLAAEPITTLPTIVIREHSLSMLHGLIELAKKSLDDGDISAGRARLRPAVKMDIPEALRLMGNTYDPRWLWAHGAVSMQYDEVKAVQYYVAAKVLGDEEARKILSALDDADAVLQTPHTR